MLAVRAPFELLVSISVGVVDALQKALFLFSVNAADYELGAVTKEGDPFAVRRNHRLETGLAGFGKEFLFDFTSKAEELVVFVFEACSPYAPVAVALGCIVERPSVRSETYASFLGWGVGNSAGSLEIHAGDIYISVQHKCELVSLPARAEGTDA